MIFQIFEFCWIGKLFAGITNIPTEVNDIDSNVMFFQPKDIIIHENYDAINLSNDIALVNIMYLLLGWVMCIVMYYQVVSREIIYWLFVSRHSKFSNINKQ